MFGDNTARGMTVTSGSVVIQKDDSNLIGISIGGGAPLCPCLYVVQVLLKKAKHRIVENMSSTTADALGLSRAILCNAFGDVFAEIGVREPQPRASEAFTQFGEAHRSIEKYGIKLLKTIRPYHNDCHAVMKTTSIFPIEVDLSRSTFHYADPSVSRRFRDQTDRPRVSLLTLLAASMLSFTVSVSAVKG
ncbi:protein kinase C alpha binding protein, putative [Ixodes scapularis]|uniref:Protein kinase C alpha binding protein, putative n=1 Tax=Ixodes scapularis TaxID=6945 RepID=B7Q7G5_IXOSC|nr:protein kinase C alpha binding protein, putative [Ixodes scapularis]|eukprot:XP_002403989.1 protein kinase C alpha binding protein, putative [Ixodes scapularis]